MSDNIHPIDQLLQGEKYTIYFKRVVDLAVRLGLLENDPNTEVGHFAFSRRYYQGRLLEAKLAEEIIRFEVERPDTIESVKAERHRAYNITEDTGKNWSDKDQIRHLILVGASYKIWSVGVSHALIYPWSISGQARPVTFRKDLSDFTKRRIIKILQEAGKLRNPDLFR